MKKLLLLSIAIFMFSCSSDDAGKSVPEACTDFVWGLKKDCPTQNEINCTYFVNHVNLEESFETEVTKEVYEYYEAKLDNIGEGQDDVCWEGTNPL